MRDTFKLNYELLATLFGGSLERLPEADESPSPSPGLMALHFDQLYRQGPRVDVALSHYYRMNGDSVPDPDMRLRIDRDAKTVEALSFQDATHYAEVYPEPGTVNRSQHRSQNQFLTTWLRNCIDQGHRFTGQA